MIIVWISLFESLLTASLAIEATILPDDDLSLLQQSVEIQEKIDIFDVAGPVVEAASPKPNIVWIMADDLGYGEVTAYHGGSQHGRIATPHLDKMAAEGMRFTNAYGGYTTCAPSRTTFFTGRHSGQFLKHGLLGTSIPAAAPGKPNVTNTAMLLQKAGYATHASGKISPLVLPAEQGFDAFLGQINQFACHNMYPHVIDSQQAGGPVVQKTLVLNNRMRRSRELCMAHPELYNFSSDVFYDDAIAWLRYVAKQEKPFFLYLSFTVPHAGCWRDDGRSLGVLMQEEDDDFVSENRFLCGQPTPTDYQYANETWPEVERDHAGIITHLDWQIGGLFATLQELGVDENTIVFFASDNGAHDEGGHSVDFFNSTGGLRGAKKSKYEGGVRSPTMARWPGKIPAGSVSTTHWAFWDVMPTLAELAGLSPDELPQDIDGISIAESLFTGTQKKRHDYLFWTWGGPDTTVNQSESGYGVRMGEMKAVVSNCAASNVPTADDAKILQLFNLSADPFETTDLSATLTDEVHRIVDFVMAQNLSCRCYQC